MSHKTLAAQHPTRIRKQSYSGELSQKPVKQSTMEENSQIAFIPLKREITRLSSNSDTDITKREPALKTKKYNPEKDLACLILEDLVSLFNMILEKTPTNHERLSAQDGKTSPTSIDASELLTEITKKILTKISIKQRSNELIKIQGQLNKGKMDIEDYLNKKGRKKTLGFYSDPCAPWSFYTSCLKTVNKLIQNPSSTESPTLIPSRSHSQSEEVEHTLPPFLPASSPVVHPPILAKEELEEEIDHLIEGNIQAERAFENAKKLILSLCSESQIDTRTTNQTYFLKKLEPKKADDPFQEFLATVCLDCDPSKRNERLTELVKAIYKALGQSTIFFSTYQSKTQ